MKRPRKTFVTAEDATLFRSSVADVTPLRRSERVDLRDPLPRPIPSQRLLDDREALKDSLNGELAWDAGMEAGDELSYVRNGIGAHTLRKLRRGYWATQAELDLHGLNVAEARELLVEFLDLCMRRGLRCIRVIHGKGLRSKNREPVLKRKVAHWLMQRDEILAFCQARRADGGSGAAMVLLKKGESRKT